MISSWRRRRADRHGRKKEFLRDNASIELVIPSHFRCPISLDLMKDPVTLSTGITYDRESIEKWIEGGNHTCPITNQVLRSPETIPNHTLRKMIQDWCVENKSYGIERIPTPRIPISSLEVSEILSKLNAVKDQREDEGCREKLVVKIKVLMKESERNRLCIISHGAGSVLSSTFEALSMASFDKNASVLEEILSILAMVLPLDGETKYYLGSNSSLRCMVWFMGSGDLSVRRNAILALQDVLSSDQRKANDFSQIEGGMEALVKYIKEPICPKSTKASLLTIYHLVSSSSSHANEKIITKLVDMGLVAMLLEMLVESERSICEKALGVLDEICNCEVGREKANEHAMATPVLVKKLLRVSDLVTEFSVSILWKISKNEKRESEGVLVEACQVGAFQKLLLLLQVGCSVRTKEKATELLKLLNMHRKRLECIDSMDFKDLKRPF